MGQLSEYWSGELLKCTFNKDTYTPPWTRLSVCLVTDIPPLNADIGDIAEPTGGTGYARQLLDLNTANWSLVNGREMVQLYDVNFPAQSAYGGVAVGYAMFTSSVNNAGLTPVMVSVGRFSVPLRMNSGVTPQIPAYTIVFSVYD